MKIYTAISSEFPCRPQLLGRWATACNFVYGETSDRPGRPRDKTGRRNTNFGISACTRGRRARARSSSAALKRRIIYVTRGNEMDGRGNRGEFQRLIYATRKFPSISVPVFFAVFSVSYRESVESFARRSRPRSAACSGIIARPL